MNRPKPSLAALLFGGLVVGGLPGCQFSYDYEVRGTIKEGAGGAPLAGVRVTLEASVLFDHPDPIVTTSDGKFTLRFKASDGEFGPARMPSWSLRLAKAGYADEVIDISPIREPDSPKANLIVVVATMRAQP